LQVLPRHFLVHKEHRKAGQNSSFVFVAAIFPVFVAMNMMCHSVFNMCLKPASGWADHSQRLQMLGDIMRLTEQFKFESGTNAGVSQR
jgi:hypothetical protein